MNARDSSRHELISSTFDAVYELDTGDRSAALAELEPELRAEVTELISALERKGSRLEPPAARTMLLGSDGAALRVGAYRLVRLVGRGGMGAVYEAERADASFVKRVAVKLIRDDVGGETVARRFERERAILAGLEHPNIARMLDGGTLEDGREYLVMEFVDGVPITTYCATHGATIRERLDLFLQVCDAVQFAHQHLVVHGDIKPGNLLVTPNGTVKLVDFGVAKIIEEGDSLTRDPLTALGALTPAYASPEQWRGEPLSMLSDVYSLGVVLYELLTGARPYAIDSRTTQDVLRAIDFGARRPSEALAQTRGDDAHGSTKLLKRTLVGELDTIVLTALEASQRRRYSSVEKLADDVRRHLDGRLVLAQPATRRYRFSKFLRRHRGGVTAATALALTVLGGGVAATIQARRAEHERAVAERISGFLKDMLSAPDASWVRAGKADVRVADVLDAAAARADTGLASDPAAEAMIRRTIGGAYRALSRFDDADRQLKMALALDLRRGAPQFPDLADDYHELGWLRYIHGDWTSALRYYGEAERRCRGRETDTSVVCYGSIADYAYALTMRSRFTEADSLYAEVLRRGKLRFKEHDAALSVVYANIGALADMRGNAARAEPMFRSALQAWRSGPEPVERVAFYHFLAANQLNQNKLRDADSVVRASARTVANTHQERAFATVLLWLDGAQARRRMGDSAGASSYVAHARAAAPLNVPSTHPLLSSIALEAGIQLLAARDPVGAVQLLRAAETSRAAAYPRSDVRVARVSGLIGIALAADAKYDEAEPLIRAASHALDSAYTSGHAQSRELHDALGELDSARSVGEPRSQAAARFARFIRGRP